MVADGEPVWPEGSGALAPGAACVLRYRYPDGRLQAELPMRVVVDRPDVTVGRLIVGTRVRYWRTADGRDPRELPIEQRFEARLTTGEHVWSGSDAPHVMRPGLGYQVVLLRRPDGTFSHWYVIFERPLQREGAVFTTVDSHLDLVIDADGTASWKDWDEAAAAVGTPYLLLEDLVAARAAGRSILADLAA